MNQKLGNYSVWAGTWRWPMAVFYNLLPQMHMLCTQLVWDLTKLGNYSCWSLQRNLRAGFCRKRHKWKSTNNVVRWRISQKKETLFKMHTHSAIITRAPNFLYTAAYTPVANVGKTVIGNVQAAVKVCRVSAVCIDSNCSELAFINVKYYKFFFLKLVVFPSRTFVLGGNTPSPLTLRAFQMKL